MNRPDDGAAGARPDWWAEDRYTVETPERVDVGYDVAGLGSRFLAGLVDTIVLGIVVAIVAYYGTLGLAYAVRLVLGLLGRGTEDAGESWTIAIMVLLVFAVFWGYYLFFELVWHGRSPGKALLGLRVIKEGGYPLGFVDSAIRNVVRLVDFLPFYYIIGALAVLIDRRSRRLGDLAAGTLVIRERRELSLETLSAAPRREPAAAPADAPGIAADQSSIPNLSRLTSADRTLLREYLLRRPSLAEPVAAALGARLAAALARKLDHDLGGEAPDAFLDRLAREASRR